MDIVSELSKINKLICNNESYYYRNIYDFILREGRIYKSHKLTTRELEIVESALKNLAIYPAFKDCFFKCSIFINIRFY